MALTSTLTISPKSGDSHTTVTATLVVTNGGASAVTVNSLRPYVNIAGSAQRATSVMFGDAYPIAASGSSTLASTEVAPSGTRTFVWKFVVNAPVRSASTVARMFDSYDVGVVCLDSAGLESRPTVVTFIMSETKRSRFGGRLLFNIAEASSLCPACC